MQIRYKTLSIILLVVVLTALQVSGGEPVKSETRRTSEPFEISVGITEYQDIEKYYVAYQTLFKEMEASEKDAKDEEKESPHIKFKFAIGSYLEVLDWYNRKKIDVAILSALPMSDLLASASSNDLKAIKLSLIGFLNVFPKSNVSPKPADNFSQTATSEGKTEYNLKDHRNIKERSLKAIPPTL